MFCCAWEQETFPTFNSRQMGKMFAKKQRSKNVTTALQMFGQTRILLHATDIDIIPRIFYTRFCIFGPRIRMDDDQLRDRIQRIFLSKCIGE